MKRLLLILIIAFYSLLFAETYYYQGFEESSQDNWSYTANPTPSRLIYWGRVNTTLGSASPYQGGWYWASWDLDNISSSLTFDNVLLPLGHTYQLSFYCFTAGLESATEYSRYCLSIDGGLSWDAWIDLLPNTNAWTLATVELPAYAPQIMLKVEAKHDGIGKFAHWDHFTLSREPVEPSQPLVYNVSAVQRVDGSGIVDIHYGLFDANADDCEISLLLASGPDASFDYSPLPVNLSGDIGNGIAIGDDKHIVWTAGEEGVDFDGSQYRIRVVADDGTFPQVATPVFDPPGGTYSTPQTVSIPCSTPSAQIYYTLDGSEPDQSSQPYIGPITVSMTTTLKAKAYKSSWFESPTATATFTIVPEGFVFVSGGTFIMGDTIDDGVGNSNEMPTHSVTLNSFYMGKYEVTQAEWTAIMGSNPSTGYGLGNSNPVYYVSWYSVLKYCNLRSMEEGLTPIYSISGSTNPANWGAVPTSDNATWNMVSCSWSANGYRLPTEAEWEYAARGATNIPDYLYSGSEDIDAVAWYSGNNSPAGSKPVGTKAPNSLGIYDMSGNVYEWCWDWYGSFVNSVQANPTGPASGSYRVKRGGYFSANSTLCRISARDQGYPYSVGVPGGDISGFRLCRMVP